MKRLIISEGHNDGIFWKLLMTNLDISMDSVDIFSSECQTLDNKKHSETIVIKRFLEPNPYNPHNTLIKLEGGKNAAIYILCRELSYYLSKIDKIILSIDMDPSINCQQTSNPVIHMNKIKQKIENHFSKTTPLFLSFNSINKNDHCYSYSCVLKNDSDVKIGDFNVVLFKNSLENSCGILKGETDEKKEKKIQHFIEYENICNFFQLILD